jgi:hypothetical protein
MGYYTNYSLKVIGKKNEGVIEQLKNENENANMAFDVNGNPDQEMKWYDHEDELKEFSLKHPKLLFRLDGEGEESGDLWVKYIKNGKVQFCPAIISFKKYSPKKLV